MNCNLEKAASTYYSKILKTGHRLPKAHVNALCLLARDGNRAAMDELVRSHMRFVVKIANQYARQVQCHVDDIIQEGVMGLMHAVKIYDHTRGINFASYAVYWIKQNIISLITVDRLVHIPKNVQDDIRNSNARIKTGEIDFHSLTEKAGYHEARAERVLHVRSMEVMSISTPPGLLPSCTHISNITSLQDKVNQDTEFEPWVGKHIKSWAMEILSPEEQKVLDCLYPLNGGVALTNVETSRRLNKSPDRIRKIRIKALGKLREVVEA